MSGRNKAVEVGDAVLTGGQEDNMMALADRAFGEAAVELVQLRNAALLRQCQHARKA